MIYIQLVYQCDQTAEIILDRQDEGARGGRVVVGRKGAEGRGVGDGVRGGNGWG